MNYDEMSDFEINKLVAECLFKSYDTMTISVNDKSSVYVDGGDSEFYDYVSGEFDYCNNPNDAWPIIEQIWDTLHTVTKADMLGLKCVETTAWRAYMCMYGCGALKAAMICFLKMKELENAHTS